MTVYIVQEPQNFNRATGESTSKFDFESAAEFGTPVTLLAFTCKPWDPGVIEELREKLSVFADGDWLILAGNPCLMGAAAAIAADVTGGTLRLLQYDGKAGRYKPVVMEV
ncbi:MAG: hypothetical protein JWN75_1245 [Candidatus Saccharibacteria bacterium]|nr:hypothetical protein [Candidatus Saccharibacteria bacterium]